MATSLKFEYWRWGQRSWPGKILFILSIGAIDGKDCVLRKCTINSTLSFNNPFSHIDYGICDLEGGAELNKYSSLNCPRTFNTSRLYDENIGLRTCMALHDELTCAGILVGHTLTSLLRHSPGSRIHFENY